MATVALTSLYSGLENWPGDLLRGDDDTVVTLRTNTSFAFTLGGSSQFAGYKVLVTGTGFSYVDGVPVGGAMSSVKIMGPGGGTLVNITGLSGPIATDLSQFHSDVFGSASDDAGPGPDGQMAWNILLATNDTVTGTSGDDRMFMPGFNTGNDTFNGFAGDDEMFGSSATTSTTEGPTSTG